MDGKVKYFYLDIPTLQSIDKQTNSKTPQNQTTAVEETCHPTLTGTFNLLIVCHRTNETTFSIYCQFISQLYLRIGSFNTSAVQALLERTRQIQRFPMAFCILANLSSIVPCVLPTIIHFTERPKYRGLKKVILPLHCSRSKFRTKHRENQNFQSNTVSKNELNI